MESTTNVPVATLSFLHISGLLYKCLRCLAWADVLAEGAWKVVRVDYLIKKQKKKKRLFVPIIFWLTPRNIMWSFPTNLDKHEKKL